MLGNEVDTDAGLVEGGRATTVVELGGVPPAAQQTAFAIMLSILKVMTNEKQDGSGRWHMIDIGLGP